MAADVLIRMVSFLLRVVRWTMHVLLAFPLSLATFRFPQLSLSFFGTSLDRR